MSDPLIPSFNSMYYKDNILKVFPYAHWLENQRSINFLLESCIKDKDSQGNGKN
jgi:hypothetical protein